LPSRSSSFSPSASSTPFRPLHPRPPLPRPSCHCWCHLARVAPTAPHPLPIRALPPASKPARRPSSVR
jgi:hypothetical protein